MVPIDTPPPSASSPSLETRLHTLLGQAGVPTLDELLQFLMRELAETSAPVEHAELSVRIALLLADGRNQLDAAAELTAEVVHPVASALRLPPLQCRTTLRSRAMRSACSAMLPSGISSPPKFTIAYSCASRTSIN